MYWCDWLVVIFAWSVVGGFILLVAHGSGCNGAINMADGW